MVFERTVLCGYLEGCVVLCQGSTVWCYNRIVLCGAKVDSNVWFYVRVVLRGNMKG